jgi:hypothetical protein
MRRVIARQSAVVLGLLQAAPAAGGAALPARDEPVAATGGQAAASRAAVVAGRPSGARAIITVGGRDRGQLIVRLDEIAARAAVLPASRLGELTREAGAGPERAGEARPGARAALLGTDTIEIAAMASNAAAILRVSGPAPIRAWPQLDQARQAHCGHGPGAADPGTAPPEAAGPGVYLSEGARGRVALLFGGLAWTEPEHRAELSAALAAISALRRLGVEAAVAVGAGLGEITGLAWADAITQEEAARLAALRAEILRPMGGLTSMARVYADRETTARLVAGSPLVRAVDEGPRQQVIAGPLPSVRMLPRRGAELGVAAEVLGATGGLHSPAMWPCVPPMAAVAAGARIGALRRRLISSVTGVDFALSGDPADLLSRQLERPALLASALALASADADLVVVMTPDPALVRAAAACCAIPVIAFPSGAAAQPAPELLAALYTAGAVPGAGRWAPGPPSARWRRAPTEPPTTPLVQVLGPRSPARC